MAGPAKLRHYLGGLVLVMGVMAAWLGLVMISHGLKTAERAFQRIAMPAVAMLETWDRWFLMGFSAVTMGLRWLFAVVAWVLLGHFQHGLSVARDSTSQMKSVRLSSSSI